ncbi:MAG: hypothetical protein EXQ71_09040 [Acidimicrobiia bacterium]|nr:hypothetical protein [Acidimicrobiia bacterium]
MFVVGKSTGAVLWLGGGLLILGGAPPVAVLYCLAPLMGVAIGTTQVITPLLTKAYLAAAGSMSATWARIKAFSAIGAATGALGGGVLLNAGTFGWGLVLNSALTLPLIVVVWRIDPAGSFQEPRPSERAWRDIRTLVRSNRALRLAFINASLVSVVVAPPLLLVVPITNDLRPGAVLVGAGILRASLYLGEFLVPLVVRRSTRQRSDLEGSILTGAGAAAVLVLLALTALILTRGVELVAWVAIGIGLGSLRYGSRAMTVGTATDAVEPGQQVHAIAAISVAAQLAAPVGLLLWGLCIDGLSATTALLAFGAVGIASAGLLRARLPR